MIHAVVQPKLPVVTLPDGTLAMLDSSPQAVDFLTEEDCQHELTMCVECWPDWNAEYELINVTIMTPEGAVVLTPEQVEGWLSA